jgi:hypothetical protein
MNCAVLLDPHSLLMIRLNFPSNPSPPPFAENCTARPRRCPHGSHGMGILGSHFVSPYLDMLDDTFVPHRH